MASFRIPVIGGDGIGPGHQRAVKVAETAIAKHEKTPLRVEFPSLGSAF